MVKESTCLYPGVSISRLEKKREDRLLCGAVVDLFGLIGTALDARNEEEHQTAQGDHSAGHVEARIVRSRRIL